MVSQSQLCFSDPHQCLATGPQDSRSTHDCSTSQWASTLTLPFVGASSSTASPAPTTQYNSPWRTASSTSTSPHSANFAGTRSEADKADGDQYPSFDHLSSSLSSNSHSNAYLEVDAKLDTEGDNGISTSIFTVSDSGSGLALGPLSAEENIWSSSASATANGTSCLPAHRRVPLSPANTDICATLFAMTLGTSTSASAASPALTTTVASDRSSASVDAPTAAMATGVPTMAEYERDAYNYHMARRVVSVPAQSQPTHAASSSTLTPTLARSNHSLHAASSSSSRPDEKGGSELCAEPVSATSRSWSRNDTGTGSGTETPAALDTPAFRTPLGVYNGFVNGHRDDKDGYFPSSSSASSVISAVSAQLREDVGTQARKRPPLRNFPSLTRRVDVEDTRPRQALSLLALPAELVAHILRIGYFSPPGSAKSTASPKLAPVSSSSLTTTSSSTIASPSASEQSHFHHDANLTNGAQSTNSQGNLYLSPEDDSSSIDDYAQLRDEVDDGHEDDSPPTITCDPHFRITLLHTCRALRAAVFADPALWSVVRLGPGDGEGGVRRALGASPFSNFASDDTGGPDKTYLGHQLALARAHPLRISLTAFWAMSEAIEGREADTSEEVFALLAGECHPSQGSKSLDDGIIEDRTKRWEAFELVCPREDEWALLARATAHRTFPNLRYLSLTFIGRSSGSAIPMPISTSISDSRRRAINAQKEPRERRTRNGRPGARYSVALPSGSFGGWRAGALPSLKGLLLRGVDLEGIVEDVLEHEYECASAYELGRVDHDSEDILDISTSANDSPEPALPALCALDIRGHGLWPDVGTLDAFFMRHARGLRRLGVHVRSGDVLRHMLGPDADGSLLVPTSSSLFRVPNLRVLEVDTSEGLNRDTAHMVRLFSGAAVSENGHSEMKRVVVKESGGVEGEELLRWSRLRRAQPHVGVTTKAAARLAITNSAISSALGALPPAMLRRVGALVLDVPAGEGGWGDARRLKEMLAIFGSEDADVDGPSKSNADSVVLGRLRRVEVRNADTLGVVREVLSQPHIITSQLQDEHDEEPEDEDEDSWERSPAEPLCAAQELVISFSDAVCGNKNRSPQLPKATIAFTSLFDGPRLPQCPSSQPALPSLMSYPTPTSTHGSLRKLILKGPTHAQVAAVLRSLGGGNVERMPFDGPQIRVQDIRL